jgi:iron complex outermembrane receptor protein
VKSAYQIQQLVPNGFCQRPSLNNRRMGTPKAASMGGKIMNRTHMLRAILCVGASATALFGAPAAFAQDSDPLVADNEIVVTAQRREESANSIGMGIQAFSGEQLDQLHVTDVRDLSSVAPSFSVQQSYQGVPIYTLRGIGFNTINLSATSTVGSYVDEVAYPFPFMMTGPIFDLQRVEVLKGPQGTLYGRNTTAGLVDFITNRPSDEIEASLTTEFGNYQTHNLEGFFTAPINESLRDAGPDLDERVQHVQSDDRSIRPSPAYAR